MINGNPSKRALTAIDDGGGELGVGMGVGAGVGVGVGVFDDSLGGFIPGQLPIKIQSQDCCT